jgi:murein L,D-transpeptidase YcbB/YkuD
MSLTADRWVGLCVSGLAALLSPVAAPAAGEAAAPAVDAALQSALAAPADVCRDSHLDGRGLARFYRGAPPGALWVDDTGPSPRARQLRAALERSEAEGLPSGRYGVAAIDARWQATAAVERACLDLTLTRAFERYARDLAQGWAAPSEADHTWHIPPPAFDPAAALLAAPPETDLAEYIGALAPAHGLYARVRAALAHYRRLAEQGGWPTALREPRPGGGEVERIALLRERLRLEGDLEPGAAAADGRPDPALASAVRRFQERHGLSADGVVGPRTLAALDTPAAERVAQLRRAMERLRWLPRDPGGHYVLVNTAGFELAVIEGDRTVLGMRAIVGTPGQATPSFTATLRLLTINPYWNVPRRIVRDKLVPRERRNPGYLAARGFRVLDARSGQWRAPDAASLDGPAPRLRQEPGPGNLMGRLSFTIPNPFDVFLHDTPARELFDLEIRACSEGCVRIERAMALALHALRRAPEWTEERIRGEIDAVRHQVLTLPEPVPVYVVYLPSWVDEDGRAHFRRDHYGRERVLAGYYPAR